jgi:hypothetical protein
VWKRLDQKISTSEKLASFKFTPFTLWTMMLPHADCEGRYWANASFIKGQALTMFQDVTHADIEAALLELDKIGLVHLYEAEGKRYLLFHDHTEMNPPGSLRYQRPRWPAPESKKCECFMIVKAPLSRCSSPSSSSSTSTEGVQGEPSEEPPPNPYHSKPVVMSPRDEQLRQLFMLAKNQKVAATPSTLQTRLDAWLSRLGASELTARLMDPSTVGRTVNELQDAWFPKVAQKALSPAPRSFRCGTCNDTGFLVDPRDGSKSQCSCKRRRAEGA